MSNPNKQGPCAACGRWKSRVMAVDAVVVDQGRVLLVKRKNDPFKGYWALPGGYMDFGETAMEASARELLEETGVRAIASVFIGLFDDPARHPEEVVSAAYLVTKWEGAAVAGDDAAEAKWFPLTELPPNIGFDHGKIIGQAGLTSEGRSTR